MQANPLPLKDIHLPEAIGWWPPAIGWWLLMIFVPLAIALAVWLFRYLTRKTAIKAAKKQLAAIKQSAWDERQKLVEISALLRRVAISLSPRTDSAGLTGTAWLAYLDRPLKDAPFSQGAGQLLASAPYQPLSPSAAEVKQLIQLVEIWLKQCHKLRRPQL
ncbi:DUF4381 domain-containing protein [Methylosoma difficile]